MRGSAQVEEAIRCRVEPVAAPASVRVCRRSRRRLLLGFHLPLKKHPPACSPRGRLRVACAVLTV